MTKLAYIFKVMMVLCLVNGKAQNTSCVYTKSDLNAKTLYLKWYLPKFVSEEPVFVWQQLPDGNWQKINTSPFVFSPSANKAQLSDKDKEAFSLLQNKQQLVGIALLHVLMQSFYSQQLATTAGFGTSTLLPENLENPIFKISNARTGQVLFQGRAIEATPQKNITAILTAKQKKSDIELQWSYPPKYVWAVLLFRKHQDSSLVNLITRLPQLTDTDTSSTKSRTINDKSALEKQNYIYQLKGITHFGDTIEISNPIKITVKDYSDPEPVAELRHLVHKRKVALTWQKSTSTDCAFYKILKTQKNDTDYTEVGRTINAVTCKFMDSVSYFQSYFYKIRSIDSAGNFSDSYPQLVDVPDQESPEFPIVTNITADSNYVDIEWKANTGKDFAGCYIFRSIHDTAASYFVRITPNPVKENKYRDELPTNTKNRYFYKLLAVDSSLNYSAYSKIVTCKLPDKTPPSAVFITTLQQQKNQIKVSWLKNPETDLKLYALTIFDSTERLNLPAIIIHRDSTEAHVKKLQYGRLYRVQLFALDSTLNRSTASNSLFLFLQAPKNEENSPDKLKLKVRTIEDSLAFSIDWRTNSGDSVTGYTLYRKTRPTDDFLPRSGFIIDKQHFLDTELVQNSNYTYQVRALLANGVIINSNQITVSTNENKRQNNRKKKR